MAKKKNEEDIRTYLIWCSEQEPNSTGRWENKIRIYKIQIPASWKVTYGLLHGGKTAYGSSGNGHILRVYEAENKQRAVFPNVTSFIDITKIDVKKNITDREKVTEIVNDITKAGSYERVNDSEIWLKIGV